MKYRDRKTLFEPGFHFKTFRCLDVFEVNTTKSWFQRSDNIDQAIGIFFINLYIKNINISKFLEQHRLTFHHGFASQRPDIAETQNSRAIRDHRNEVATCGHIGGF